MANDGNREKALALALSTIEKAYGKGALVGTDPERFGQADRALLAGDLTTELIGLGEALGDLVRGRRRRRHEAIVSGYRR